jgi:hypothetical protein
LSHVDVCADDGRNPAAKILMRGLQLSAILVVFTLSDGIAQINVSPGPLPPPTDNLLTLSGFVPRVADTPAKLAHLRKLPADRVVTRTINGRTSYLYADPMTCVCVYVGTPEAWQTYQNGGPPGYVGDDGEKARPRFNPDRIVDEMAMDPDSDQPGAPTFDDYLFGAPP